MSSLIQTIYIEESVKDLPKTQEILKKNPNVLVTIIDRYTEIFNRHRQNFRVQKEKPALILAKKTGKILHKIPKTYTIGNQKNAYFSHLLNCPFDCSYCFLQGMYPSAHFVCFVNFQDFKEEIKQEIESSDEKMTFFSGYDADSLALERFSGFAKEFIPFFKKYPKAELEIRTKSIFIKPLLEEEASSNIVVAFTLSPEIVASHIEKKAPPLKSRLLAIEKLLEKGYPIGLRFDPLIYIENYQKHYKEFFDKVLSIVPSSKVHSVTMGTFRLPKPIFKNMQKHSNTALLASCSSERSGMMTYHKDIEDEMIDYCKACVLEYLPASKLFIC